MTDQPRQPIHEDDKYLHDKIREDAHRAHDATGSFWEAINESAIKSGDAALRAALLINGGAAVSMLAFIGGLAAQNRIHMNQINDIASSLMFFAYGVASAVAAMAFSYLTNYMTAVHTQSFERHWNPPFIRPGTKTGRYARYKTALHLAAVVLGTTSLILFVCGMVDVRQSIGRLQPS